MGSDSDATEAGTVLVAGRGVARDLAVGLIVQGAVETGGIYKPPEPGYTSLGGSSFTPRGTLRAQRNGPIGQRDLSSPAVPKA